MKVVTQAQFVPGVCLICGGSDSDRPWFLDIEKQAEFWGNIYFCNLCCGTMAVLFRCGDVSAYQERVQELEITGQELLERCLGYESALSALRSISVADSSVCADLLAHKSLGTPEPEVGRTMEPAGIRFAESSNDDQMGELSELEFEPVKPDLTTGW